MKCHDQLPRIKQLESQIDLLYAAVNKANEHFWPALLNPADELTARPDIHGKPEQAKMQIVLQYSYDAWIETPGAIDLIRRKLEHSSEVVRGTCATCKQSIEFARCIWA